MGSETISITQHKLNWRTKKREKKEKNFGAQNKITCVCRIYSQILRSPDLAYEFHATKIWYRKFERLMTKLNGDSLMTTFEEI
jgi:hypothetical protein